MDPDIAELEAKALELLAEDTRESRLAAAQLLTQRAWLQERHRIEAIDAAERPAESEVRQLLGEAALDDQEDET